MKITSYSTEELEFLSMAKIKEVKAIKSNGEASFINHDNEEYSALIPQELLKFINICDPSSVGIWHYGKTEAGKIEFTIDASGAIRNWGPTVGVRIDWGRNTSIMKLEIRGREPYNIKQPPAIETLINLLQNPLEMFDYLLNNADLNAAQKEWMLEANDF